MYYVFIFIQDKYLLLKFFANMSNHSTQRLASSCGYFNLPIVRSQRQPILQHTLACTYSLVLGLARLFDWLRTKNWTSPCSTAECRVKIYARAHACFSVHSGILNETQGISRTSPNQCFFFFFFFFSGPVGRNPPTSNNNKLCLFFGCFSHFLSPQKQFLPPNYISRKKICTRLSLEVLSLGRIPCGLEMPIDALAVRPYKVCCWNIFCPINLWN